MDEKPLFLPEIPTELLPPKELRLAVGGSYKQIGKEFLNYFIELGELKSTDTVLDVGCGSGRMAVPLTQYLDTTGRYEGFDIFADGVRWCQDAIAPRYPNFHFHLADIYNHYYHPNGQYRASEYQFPYADSTFDFVFLTSVFTHLLPQDLENYLQEIARVLKPGGRSLMTFYLINPESTQLLHSEKSAIAFPYNCGTHRLADQTSPESAIAYTENFVLEKIEQYGLKIKRPIHYGSWCGRPQFLSAQDIVICQKNKDFFQII